MRNQQNKTCHRTLFKWNTIDTEILIYALSRTCCIYLFANLIHNDFIFSQIEHPFRSQFCIAYQVIVQGPLNYFAEWLGLFLHTQKTKVHVSTEIWKQPGAIQPYEQLPLAWRIKAEEILEDIFHNLFSMYPCYYDHCFSDWLSGIFLSCLFVWALVVWWVLAFFLAGILELVCYCLLPRAKRE